MLWKSKMILLNIRLAKSKHINNMNRKSNLADIFDYVEWKAIQWNKQQEPKHTSVYFFCIEPHNII